MLKHLSELIADAAIYGWESVLAFYAVWLQQLENGRADWGDEAKKLEFQRALVWNKAIEGHTTKTFKTQPTGNTLQKVGKEATGRPTTAKPGTKACAPYNAGSAMHKLITQHICTSVHIVSQQHGVSAPTKIASAVEKVMMDTNKDRITHFDKHTTSKLRTATPSHHGSKLMVRPDRPQNSQGYPVSTPGHRGKVSVGFHEPRGCGGVRIREDFTAADSDNQSLTDTQDTYVEDYFHPMPWKRPQTWARHPPEHPLQQCRHPPPPHHGDSNKWGLEKTKVSVNPLPPPEKKCLLPAEPRGHPQPPHHSHLPQPCPTPRHRGNSKHGHHHCGGGGGERGYS